MIAAIVESVSALTGENPKNSSSVKKADIQFVDRLAKRWSAFQKQGLDGRHEIGKRLNDRLGPPNKRLPYGGRVLKMVAERTKISQSDISRMRWLAFHFPNLLALWEAYPHCKSWDEFKAILPSLNGKGSKEHAAKQRRTSQGLRFKAIGRLAASLRGKLHEVHQNTEMKLPDQVWSELKALVDAAQALICPAVDMPVVKDEQSLTTILA